MSTNSLNCYIIDDELYSIKTIEEYIENTPGLKCIGSNVDPLLAVEEIKTGIVPDILFLDVNMPGISGIDIIDLLPSIIAIILITAHARYALAAYEKDVKDFLLKPFTFVKFIKSVNKVRNYINFQKLAPAKLNHQIFINSGVKGRIKQINVNDIIHIESLSHLIGIFIKGEKYATRISLKEVEELLAPFHQFIRIHRAFIINTKLIDYIDGNNIIMNDNIKIPIGNQYKDNFMKVINSRLIKNIS